jgi:hypothetical protein
LECFVEIWDILWSFGRFFPVLVSCTKKHLATLNYGQLWPLLESDIFGGHKFSTKYIDLKKRLLSLFMASFSTDRLFGKLLQLSEEYRFCSYATLPTINCCWLSQSSETRSFKVNKVCSATQNVFVDRYLYFYIPICM